MVVQFKTFWRLAQFSGCASVISWSSITSIRRFQMRYQIEFAPSALEQIRALPRVARRLIGAKLDRAQQDLIGDIKKLRGFKNKHRLRAGNYRVLFELEGTCLVV